MNKQLTMWDLTLSTDISTDNEMDIIDELKQIARNWVFQLEKSETGYIHWQIRLNLIKRKRKSELLTLLDDTFLEKASVSPTNNTTKKGKVAFQYVMKADTRIRGPWKDDDPPPKFKQSDYIEYCDFFPFQKDVVEISSKFNGRQCNILYDPDGCSGKSTIQTYMRYEDLCCCLPFCKDYKELVQMALCQSIECPRESKKTKCFIIDMPKAMEKKELKGFYAALETIKGGYLFDQRYKYRDYTIDKPCVWVFTNELPDTNLLSMDRWKIWTINDSFELIEDTSRSIPNTNKVIGQILKNNERKGIPHDFEEIQKKVKEVKVFNGKPKLIFEDKLY